MGADRDDPTPEWIRTPRMGSMEWHHRHDSSGDRHAPFATPRVHCGAAIDGENCEGVPDRDDIPAPSPICVACSNVREIARRNLREAAQLAASREFERAAKQRIEAPPTDDRARRVRVDLDILIRHEISQALDVTRYARLAKLCQAAQLLAEAYTPTDAELYEILGFGAPPAWPVHQCSINSADPCDRCRELDQRNAERIAKSRAGVVAEPMSDITWSDIEPTDR